MGNIVDNIKHKVFFWRTSNLGQLMYQYGLPFLCILVVWEVIEDFLFPLGAYFLGNIVSPVFYGFIPFAWIICLHPIVVPVLWLIWCKVVKWKSLK